MGTAGLCAGIPLTDGGLRVGAKQDEYLGEKETLAQYFGVRIC